MGNEYYGAPTTPTSDYLAHYGVKGMKWGVRKAIASGNDRALGRQYRKAQKKLAKLERQAASGKKYAKRAAALGAGAAAAGGLAAIGTQGVAQGVGYAGKAFSQGAKGLGGAMQRVGGAMTRRGIRGGGRMTAAGQAVSDLSKHNASGYAQGIREWGRGRHDVASAVENISSKYGHAGAGQKAASELRKRGMGSVSNNTLFRAGAGAAGLGLAGGAAYNAYRAATTKKAAAKAAQFRKEMNKAFAGTQYANGGAPKRKRRRG